MNTRNAIEITQKIAATNYAGCLANASVEAKAKREPIPNKSFFCRIERLGLVTVMKVPIAIKVPIAVPIRRPVEGLL
jgi:hypothetical protein